MSTEKHPFDFDELKKGDTFAPDVLEQITNHQRDTKEYAFAVMHLREQIEDELEARGRPVVVASVKNNLTILTDEEAQKYTAERFAAAQRAMCRAHRRAMIIDRTNLSQEADGRHQRQLQVQGAKLAAISVVNRRLNKPQPKAIGESNGND